MFLCANCFGTLYLHFYVAYMQTLHNFGKGNIRWDGNFWDSLLIVSSHSLECNKEIATFDADIICTKKFP